MAIGYASQTEPADVAAISKVADGINHSVPTHKELQSAITRLYELNLITKQNEKYTLSKIGSSLFDQVRENEETLFGIWKELEREFSKIIKT